MLDQLGKAQYFPTLDLAREKTAFVTQQGLFEFGVMPFGLTNAPTVVQWLMQKVVKGLNLEAGPNFVGVYIDDILAFSQTMKEHLDHLQRVLERLTEAGLKQKPSKCLGHVITPEGLKPNTKQVEEFPVPKSVTQVRQFLG